MPERVLMENLIYEVNEQKARFMEFLLEGDEQENMIMRYLDRGRLFVLDDKGPKVVCVVTDEGNGVLEIKNIATRASHRCKGYAKRMIHHLEQFFSGIFMLFMLALGILH